MNLTPVRIFRLAVVSAIPLTLMLVTGCVSSPYSSTDVIRKYAADSAMPPKPEGVISITHYVRQPGVAIPVEPELGTPYPVERAVMGDIVRNAGIFEPAHHAYLTEAFSRLTTELKPEDKAYFATKNVSGGYLGFMQDKEWGDCFYLAGTVKPISGGSIFAAAMFGIIKADVEALGFRFNKQGQIVYAQRSQVAIGTIGGGANAVGYVREGAKIDVAATERVEDGVTTQEQIKATFGMPNEIKTLRDGSIVWVYSYKKTGRSVAMMFVPGANLFSKNKVREYELFEVRFKEGVVLNHGYVDQMK